MKNSENDNKYLRNKSKLYLKSQIVEKLTLKEFSKNDLIFIFVFISKIGKNI